MNSPLPEAVNPIAELRGTMERIRQIRDTGLPAYAIAAATYEQDTQAVHQEFIDLFAQFLPVEQTSYPNRNQGDSVVCKLPEHVPPALAFGINLLPREANDKAVVFPIGERLTDEASRFTEVLVMYSSPDIESSTFVIPIVVPTEQWNSKRDSRLAKLTATTDANGLANRFSPETNGFMVKEDELLTTATSYYFMTINLNDPSRWDWRGLLKSGKTDADKISHIPLPKRRIRGTDFTDFNVMYHLEILAAAFGIERDFDALKAIRGSQLPPALEEKIFGFGDFRTVTESLHRD